jgi:hypothetical protein
LMHVVSPSIGQYLTNISPYFSLSPILLCLPALLHFAMNFL